MVWASFQTPFGSHKIDDVLVSGSSQHIPALLPAAIPASFYGFPHLATSRITSAETGKFLVLLSLKPCRFNEPERWAYQFTGICRSAGRLYVTFYQKVCVVIGKLGLKILPKNQSFVWSLAVFAWRGTDIFWTWSIRCLGILPRRTMFELDYLGCPSPFLPQTFVSRVSRWKVAAFSHLNLS